MATDREVVLNVAMPLSSVPVPKVVPPSRNVMLPVAVAGATVAVKMTGTPDADGLADDVKETVVTAGFTVWVDVAEVLVASFVSPP